MPSANFFSKLGIFSIPGFLDRDRCELIRREMDENAHITATVGKKTGEYVVDNSIRSAKFTDIGDETERGVHRKLLDVMPRISEHFGIKLAGTQPLQFLKYQTGDHYRAHVDRRDDEQASEIAQQRRISAVIFLNDQTEEKSPGGYVGGALTFYGLLQDPRLANRGLALTGQAGLLVAFRPETVHEVTRVDWGIRNTIVTWYK